MKQNEQYKLGCLEIGRFIAAALVVLSHLGPTVASLSTTPVHGFLRDFDAGPIAVKYFFVLSGFVIASKHSKDFGKISTIPVFFWRRFCRIYPLFWLAMLFPVYQDFHNLTLISAFKLLFLIPVPITDLLAPAWSLHFEIAFYLSFGLCLLPYIGRLVLSAWILFSVWTAASAAFGNSNTGLSTGLSDILHHGWSSDFLSPLDIYFLAGVLAGLAFVRLHIPRWLSLFAMIISSASFIIGLILTDWGSTYGPPSTHLVMSLIIAAVIFSFSIAERNSIFHTGRISRSLGAMSYPLYIFHWVVFLIYLQCLGSLRFNAEDLIYPYLAGAIVILSVTALITFKIDQPLQKLLRRLG